MGGRGVAVGVSSVAVTVGCPGVGLGLEGRAMPSTGVAVGVAACSGSVRTVGVEVGGTSGVDSSSDGWEHAVAVKVTANNKLKTVRRLIDFVRRSTSPRYPRSPGGVNWGRAEISAVEGGTGL